MDTELTHLLFRLSAAEARAKAIYSRTPDNGPAMEIAVNDELTTYYNVIK